MTIDSSSLIERFVDAALRHGEGTEKGLPEVSNLAQDEIREVLECLKANESRGLGCLGPLLSHDSPFVKLWAGYALLEVKEDEAVRALEEVADNPGLAGFSAEITLEEWRKGTLQLP